MGRAITVDMPQEVYESLAKAAQQAGQTPEELAARWLAAAAQQSANDPLERFIGGIPTTVPDWADRHDHYIGRTLKDSLAESDYEVE